MQFQQTIRDNYKTNVGKIGIELEDNEVTQYLTVALDHIDPVTFAPIDLQDQTLLIAQAIKAISDYLQLPPQPE